MPQLQMSSPPIARACTGEQHEQAGARPAIVLSPPSIVPPSCVHHGDTAMGEGGEIMMVDKRFYNGGTSYPGSHQQLLAAARIACATVEEPLVDHDDLTALPLPHRRRRKHDGRPDASLLVLLPSARARDGRR